MQIRRVVTGHDGQGKSVFISDACAPRAKDFSDIPGYGFSLVWLGGATCDGDQSTLGGSLLPGAGGSSLLMISLPPDAVMAAPLDPQRAFGEMLEELPGLIECFEAEAPGMHRTPTIDYVVLIEGELWLELDDGEERLVRSGEVVIQNGTRHAWRNKSDKVAKAAVFMQGLVR
ncbi:cupin domain-containing protein [Pseudomonas sp. MWU13-2105]|uniref:cupin domain-containing protein n=1 Tax=Pseudomonas sp. MWU13-2105 TaxID=2935074 RepID=UPI00200F8D33|nr:cupin domain-containing protein [Pseudomonas sp. MWU13-2105]